MKNRSVLLLCLMGLLCVSATVMGWPSSHCGPNRIPYDPATQGCCKNPDGIYEVTDNPENANMNDYAEDNGLCNGMKFGVTFCYNGEKRTAICPYGNTFPDEFKTCIQMHEDSHKNDSYGTCGECDSPNVEHTSASGHQNSECAALEATYSCLGSNDSSNVNWMILKSAADDRYDANGCTFPKGI